MGMLVNHVKLVGCLLPRLVRPCPVPACPPTATHGIRADSPPDSPRGLHKRVAVLEAPRGLKVVEEAVHLLVARHERGGVVVPGRAEHSVGVAHPRELGRVSHGGNVCEPPARRRVEVLRNKKTKTKTKQQILQIKILIPSST